MKQEFKNYFSESTEAYSTYRPNYPTQLFSYLAYISNHQKTAWDCATGNGQAAVFLAHYFSTVIATDASSTQIDNAIIAKGVSYQVASAENSGLQKNSIDLITVAQAFHWFNKDGFIAEANRVLKDKGIIAIWTYNLISVEKQIDNIIQYFYSNIVGDYWPKERQLVEDGYKTVHFLFRKSTHQHLIWWRVGTCRNSLVI